MSLGLGMALLLLGCGGSGGTGGGPPPQCGKPGRTGITVCDFSDCAAGQYCRKDPKATFRECKSGCASDDGCSANEWCVRCNSDATGVCRACTDDGSSVCKPPEEKKCERDTFWDRKCVSPGKAYGSPLNKEPEGLGTCAQLLAGIWCCGAPVKPDCTRNTALDVQCGGKKAFVCAPDEVPIDPGCKNNFASWCCP